MALGGGDLVTVKVQGLSELQEMLEAMPEKVAKKGIRAALRAGGNVLRTEIMLLAPKDTGFLAEHFGTKIKMRRDELAGSAFVGPKGKVDYPAFMSGAYRIVRSAKGRAKKVGRVAVATVARFLEFGTSKMGKRPFITPAFDSKRTTILDAMVDKLKDAVTP